MGKISQHQDHAVNYYTKAIKLTLLALFCITPATHAVTEGTAKTVGGIGGTAIALVLGKFLATIPDTTGNKAMFALGGVVVGAWLGFCIRDAFQPYTPTGKFAFAKRQLTQVLQSTLLNTNFTTPDDLTGGINARFGTSWSLVIAREELLRESQRLHGARLALTSAYEAARKTPADYATIMEQYTPLLTLIESTRQKIDAIVAFITSDGRYHNQVGLYEQHVEIERARQKELAPESKPYKHSGLESALGRETAREQVHATAWVNYLKQAKE